MNCECNCTPSYTNLESTALMDIVPENCPVRGLSRQTPNCLEKCKKIIETNKGCKGYPADIYCPEQCNRATSFGPAPTPDIKNAFPECKNRGDRNKPNCASNIIACCKNKCQGNKICEMDCVQEAQDYCMGFDINPDREPVRPKPVPRDPDTDDSEPVLPTGDLGKEGKAKEKKDHENFLTSPLGIGLISGGSLLVIILFILLLRGASKKGRKK